MLFPKLVITDIDGVWTDGGMYYDESGNEWKKFSTSDSAGVLFLRENNIPLAVMTGELTPIVERRCAKLKIEHLFLGCKDKLALARNLCQELGVDLLETAFIGDDLNDISLLKEVGLSGCPSNAPSYVKSIVHLVGSVRGGDGAFREFIETILSQHSLLETTISNCIQQKTRPT